MGRPTRRIEISDAADRQLRALEFTVHVHPKVRFRATLLRLHRAGWTVTQLAQHFDRNPQAVHNDLTRFEQQGIAGLADGQAPGKPPLVTPLIEPFLHEKLREDRFWTAAMLCEAVAQQFQVTISPRTMAQHLHRLGRVGQEHAASVARTISVSSDPVMMTPSLELVIPQLRALTQQHGLAEEVGAADADQLLSVQQKFSLPKVWVELYRLFSPRGFLISPPGNEQGFYGVTELDDAQAGYDDEAWPVGWLVIGGEGEYPLVIDTASAEDTGVYLAQLEVIEMRKKRAVMGLKARQLSSTLNGFLEGLRVYIDQYYSTDEPPALVPEHIRLAQYRSILSTWRLQPDLAAHILVWQSWLGIAGEDGPLG